MAHKIYHLGSGPAGHRSNVFFVQVPESCRSVLTLPYLRASVRRRCCLMLETCFMRLLFVALTMVSVSLSVTPASAGAATKAGKKGSKHHEYAPPKSKNCRNTGKFSVWLANFKKEAAAKGISQRTIRAALGSARLNPKIIRRDRRQGFFAQSFVSFQKSWRRSIGSSQAVARLRKTKQLLIGLKKSMAWRPL